MADTFDSQRSHADYTVACICPMGVELAPVEAMLDEFHEPLPTSRDFNAYTLGKMSGHNIVIAIMPKTGTNVAATVATQLLTDFPSVRFSLLVGIGGGVPGTADIRLGDVVVSQPTGTFSGIVQYDLGKQTKGGNFERTGSLREPPAVLSANVRKLDSQHRRIGPKLSQFVVEMLQHNPAMQQEYSFPTTEQDRLFFSTYEHQSGPTCDLCDVEQTISRSERQSKEPTVHYGTIGSANIVIKDAALRDRLQQAYHVLCVEMEAAGLMSDFPCLVIRGICDYADSHKNKKWQPYAAAVAAAYMKELLTVIPIREVAQTHHAIGSASLKPVLPPYAYSSLQPVATYVSRPELEQRLQTQLAASEDSQQSNKTKTVVIWGLGGAGKSQLALSYVQKHVQDYRAVFWIEAGRKETIERDYSQIYKQLYPDSQKSGASVSSADAVDRVKGWLRGQDGRCLWVMDSADEVEDDTSELYVDLSHYLPDGPQLHRIITTRNSQLQHIDVQGAINVMDMSENEAVELFRRCTGKKHTNEEESIIKTIVTELSCLALAVTLAGSYVRETPRIRSNLSLYIQEYRVNRKRFLNRKTRQHTNRYHDSVSSTWEMSFSAIERQDSLAARLLTMLSFCNFDDIFLELFRILEPTQEADGPSNEACDKMQWAQMLCSDQEELNVYAIEASLTTLQTYSLVSWREQQEAYAMHKLVHAWGYDRLQLEHQRMWSCAVLGFLSELTAKYENDVLMETRLVPHVKSNLIAVLSTHQPDHCLTSGQREHIGRLADLLKGRGKWNDELPVRTFLWQNTKLTLGPEHLETLNNMSELGLVLNRQGAYERAAHVQRQTVDLKGKVLGPEHPSTLVSMSDLGSLLCKQGKFIEAEDLDRQVSGLFTSVYGPEHTYTLTSMSNLAQVLQARGKLAEAEEMHRQTFELRRKTSGLEHPQTLSSMNNLARILKDRGNFIEAEKMDWQTLELKKKVLGPEHPDTLRAMNCVAQVLCDQGKHKQAEIMHQQVIEVKVKVLGPEHPDTLLSINNLALVLHHQGSYVVAEEMHRQNFALREKVLGLEHPQTQTSMHNLSQVLTDQGKYQQAEEILRQTIEQSNKLLGAEHPKTLVSMNCLAVLLTRLGDEKAEGIQQQTLNIQRKVLGPEHLDTLISMANLAAIRIRQNKHGEAEEMLKEAFVSFSKVLGPENPYTLKTTNRLASVLRYQGKHKEADALYTSTVTTEQQSARDGVGNCGVKS